MVSRLIHLFCLKLSDKGDSPLSGHSMTFKIYDTAAGKTFFALQLKFCDLQKRFETAIALVRGSV